MKFETLINLAGSVIFGLLGITALIGGDLLWRMVAFRHIRYVRFDGLCAIH